MLQVCLVMYLFGVSFACWGNSGSWGPGDEEGNEDDDNGEEDQRFKGPLNDSKKWMDHWPGEVAPSEVENWVANYKREQEAKEAEYLKANGGKLPKYPADSGTNWPKHWIGLGLGTGGVAPPPYAYVYNSAGKPDFCYLPPKKGDCTRYRIRWGFNHNYGDCKEFVYSGCNGNANNFYTKKRCREACLNVPKGNCRHDPKKLYHEHLDWISDVVNIKID